MARHLESASMPRLTLVESKKPQKRDQHLPEGLVAKQLLEENGYLARHQQAKNSQFEFPCPFHQEPGSLPKSEPTRFYLNSKTSQFYCQHSSCQEGGNLQTLEKYFGVDSDPTLLSRYKSKETRLTELEAALTDERREFLRDDKGLNDTTITKFRIGWDIDKECYVIPYLEQRRPVAFRFYDPVQRGVDEKGRPMYGGPNGSKYWWERAEESIVNKDSIGVLGQEDSSDEAPVLRLFNPSAAQGDAVGRRVYICEGEFKAMVMDGHGYSAVSIPGVNSFKREWAQYFMHAREIVVLMDNDNPDVHRQSNCKKCETVAKDDCTGHNVGQEGAARLVDFFGFRARNVVLPLPTGAPKTDINEFLIRDEQTWTDFERIVDGKSADTKYVVSSLQEIRANPPEEAVFVVSNGLLPRGGRLLVTGAPKVGKSIWVQNLVLSIASGLPFLDRFPIANTGLTPGHRVLLLDRELSKRSLFDRMNILTDEKPALSVAAEKLYIDHDFRLHLDLPGAVQALTNLINTNGIEVVVFDTGYKFFAGGDFESSRSLTKVFATLDEVIQDTGVSLIITHHQKKGSNAKGEGPNVDSVAGSFLWTGWANGTVLLNFKNRSVADPYTTICSFTAFRDAAAPEPLLLKRDKTSITYKEVVDFSFDELQKEEEKQSGGRNNGYTPRPKLSYEALADLLLQQVPVPQDTFLHQASAHFGMKPENLKLTLVDILDRHADFVREGKGSTQSPYIWRYRHSPIEETYDDGLDDSGQLRGQTNIEEMLG